MGQEQFLQAQGLPCIERDAGSLTEQGPIALRAFFSQGPTYRGSTRLRAGCINAHAM
jgi:hypothetical protein